MAAMKLRLQGLALAGALLGLSMAGVLSSPSHARAQTNSAAALSSSSNVATPGAGATAGLRAPSAPAPTAVAQPPANGGAAPAKFVMIVIAALTFVGLVALLWIYAVLRDAKGWSLPDALSEDTDMPLKDAAGNPVMNNGSPVLAPVLVASTSRLIALYGMLAILLLYLGVGVFVLYDVGTGQPLPPHLDQVQSFLLGGLTLFAPYVVNKFANVFASLAPKSNP